MGTKSNFRARVMKYVHHLLSATKKSWRYCLLKAWELYRFAKRMRGGGVKFAYGRVSGSIRYAIGIPKNVSTGVASRGKRVTKPSHKTFSYLDVDK